MLTRASVTAITAATAKMIACLRRWFGLPRFRVALLGTRYLFFSRTTIRISARGRLVNGGAAPAEQQSECSALAEMFRQFEPLGLVVGADAAAVKLIGTGQHFLVDQPADDLAVFQDERHFARADFQHRARTQAAGSGVTETGIKKSGVMHAEFADQRIEWNHLGGEVRRHLHG